MSAASDAAAAQPRRSRADQREQTRQRLLDAAAAAFAEHGFQGASIDDIAARAGFTRGAFYSNFDDKSELLVQLCERRIDDFVAGPLPDVLAADRETRIQLAARWIAEQEAPVELLVTTELARLRHHDPEVAATLDRVMTTIVGAVERLLEVEGSTAGLTAAERHDRALALMAGVLGLDLLRHLGVPSGARITELLLEAVLPAEPVRPTTEDQP